MDFDIDASDLLYIVGIVLAIVAVVYFSREIVADLSPTIKSALLLTAFPAFLVAGNLIHKRILDKFLYILSVLSYLVFLWYIFDTFDLGNNVIFLALITSSIVFIGMGYQWGKGVKIEEKWKRGILACLLIFAVGLFIFDVAGPQPSYELDLRERVSLEGAWEGEKEQPIPIGNLVVKNNFLFSRYTDFPDLNACLYTPEKHEIYLHYPRWEVDIIAGKSTEQIGISLLPRTYMENIESLPTETASSFPDKAEEPKLVIAIGEGG